MALIAGGYYLKARMFDNSAIAHKPPIFRVLWDWLQGHAAHQKYRKYGIELARGQLLLTYGEIQEETHWKSGNRKDMFSKPQISKVFKWFQDEKMIIVEPISGGNAGGNAVETPVETEYGGRAFLVTICNYNYYQTPSNYIFNPGGNAGGNAVETPVETPLIIIDKNYNNNKKRENVGYRQYLRERVNQSIGEDIRPPKDSFGWEITENVKNIKDSQGHLLTLYTRDIKPEAVGRLEDYHIGYIAQWYCDICQKTAPAREDELDNLIIEKHQNIIKKLKERKHARDAKIYTTD